MASPLAGSDTETRAAWEAALRQTDSELNSPSAAVCRVPAGVCSETEKILLFLKWALMAAGAASQYFGQVLRCVPRIAAFLQVTST